MKYPGGNSKGKSLFSKLEKRAGKGKYDDEYLRMLVEYRQLYPESEHFDIFYAKYAVFHKNYAVALESAKSAFGKRKVNLEVWRLLIACYLAMGRPDAALPFQGYCCKFYRQPLELSMPKEMLLENLGRLSVAMGQANYAPLCKSRMRYVEGEMKSSKSTFGGEFLPMDEDYDGDRYWVGVYNELSSQGSRGMHLEHEMESEANGFYEGDDFVYDIMRAKVMPEMVIDPEGSPVVIPVAAASPTAMKQRVNFSSEGLDESACLGQWEYSFFRVEQTTRIFSEHPLAFGKPIRLRHDPQRKRVVLHILADALSWNVYRDESLRYMPNTMEFFSKGIVFDQHFSASEYTYPSLASIETGMYPHHSQLFHEQAAVSLDKKFTTLSEQMKALGYYCTSPMNTGEGIYNETSRGYDRLQVNFCDVSAYAGVERTIRQLDAFAECDQFIFLHFGETHPWQEGVLPFPIETSAGLPLERRLAGRGTELVSVRLSDAPVYQDANRWGVRHVDRALGCLFDYLLSHYEEDEFIVQLYSDHGVSVYNKKNDLLGNNQTNAAYMLRGSGIPSLGTVKELTSTVDIYPVLGKLAGFPVGDWVDGNLPGVLGGKERDHVASYSLFPGQTYKLCIRTKNNEFRMESREPVNEDGTVDLSGAKLSACTRDESHRPIENAADMERFLALAKKYTASINHEGRQWRSLSELPSES